MNLDNERYLRPLWKDRCSVYQYTGTVTDGLTSFDESELYSDIPCRLSFETQNIADGDPVAAVSQGVKLFTSARYEIPAGCKLVVTRRTGGRTLTLTFGCSGEPAVYEGHQEITLRPFEGYA